MAPIEDSLDRPAKEVAHRIALNLLGQAMAARSRLRDPHDLEALHDFRVALRRLRTVLRAYGPQLEKDVGRRAARDLKRLAAATGESRDLEVHLAWLLDERDRLSASPRIGAAWLIRTLRARKRLADASLRRCVAGRVPRIRERLEARLRSYRLSLDLDGASAEPSYGVVTSQLLLDLGRAMRDHLAQVRSLGDQAGAHAARIEGKRLRYLLEPVARIPGGGELLVTLKQLQDGLGNVHDAQVFAQEIAGAIAEAAAEEKRRLSEALLAGESVPAARRRSRHRSPLPGLLALTARLGQRGATAFGDLQALGWWTGGPEDFFGRLERFATALAVPAAPSVEIERKFLLRGVPPAARESPVVDIEQGYLPGQRLAERLRHVHSAEGDAFFRTVKLGLGVTRTELEEETSPELFEALWPFTAGRRLTKRRMRVPDGERTWEVDEFTDRPLVLAELELPTEDTPVVFPPWLVDYLVEEVTHDAAYLNLALAR